METTQAILEEAARPSLQITKQDFLQEAKSLIAQHYQRLNENKFQSTSVNVFKNKHQKPKTVKFIPLDIKKNEILDVVQEHRTVLRSIGFPKEPSKCEHLKDTSQQHTSVKKSLILNIKEKYQPRDPFTKEKVKLGKIMTDIESVSKKMEKEKQLYLGISRALERLHTLPTHPGLPLQSKPSAVEFQKEADRMLYDWRGVVSTRSFPLPQEYTRKFSGTSAIFRDFLIKSIKKKGLKSYKPESKSAKRLKPIIKSDKLDSKVKRIGPHIEIFQLFQGKKKLVYTKRIIKLVTLIQAYVRGWLERKRLQRLTTKALGHGPNLKAVINMYCTLIHRVRHRLGLWRTRQIIDFSEVEEWMDRKKFYETMFAKREGWQGMERSELLKYFNDCGHFPTQAQIDEYWDLFHRHSPGKYSEVIRKSSAVELLFTLYPPQGAKVNLNMRLRSTWLRPMVDGEEGYKYIVTGHPILKRANIQIVGRLVANSIRERKFRQFQKP